MILSTDSLRDDLDARLRAAGVAPEWAREMAAAAPGAWEQNPQSQHETLWALAGLLRRAGCVDESSRLLAQIAPGLAVPGPLPSLPRPLADWLVTRVLRPGREVGAWRVDLGRVRGDDGMGELAYARFIPTLAGVLIPLWEPEAGNGTLLLAGLRQHAIRISRGGARAVRVTRDWRADLEAALARESARRGWPAHPAVVLDEAV